MSDWTTIASFETSSGVEYTLEQRYDHSEAKYEARFCHKPRDMKYEQNRWYLGDKVTQNEY